MGRRVGFDYGAGCMCALSVHGYVVVVSILLHRKC